MRILSLIAVVFFVSSLATPARAGMAEDCQQFQDSDLKIDGCTAMIQTGLLQGKSLATVYSNRAYAYVKLGKYHLGIADFYQALRRRAYYKLDEYRRAIEDYDQELQIDPGLVNVYYNRGISYRSLGEYERAIRDWEQAIRIDGASRTKPWQEYLKGKGHYSGAIDGIYGPGTRRALMACARDPRCGVVE